MPPWEKYARPAPDVPAAEGPWDRYGAEPQQPQKPAFSGSLLPFSRDQQGNVSFDSNAGILGTIKRAVTLPGDVAAGRAQLPSAGGVMPGSVPEDDPMASQAIGRVFDLATIANPVNPAVRAGSGLIPGAKRSLVAEKPNAPTADALKRAADQGYKQARELGVDIRGSAVGDMSRGVQSSLEQDGIFGELAPKTFSILRKIESPPEGSIATISTIDAVRRALRNAAKDFTNPTEQAAAKRSIERLDEFTANLPPESVLAGPAATAGEILGKARGNYAAAMRSDKITGATERADLNAAVANSGQNLDNSIRQRIRDIITKPKERAGYSTEELAALEKVARGGAGTNTARAIGNLLGGGGGLGAAVVGGLGGAGGHAAFGPVGAIGVAAPLVGVGMKQLANALTSRRVSKADELVRKRSPLYEERSANPSLVPRNQADNASLMRALMLYLQSTQNAQPLPAGLLDPNFL